MTLTTVAVPGAFEAVFARAEAIVAGYFADRSFDPQKGTIEISGERYVLVRAAALSAEFFDLVRGLFGAGRRRKADDFARNILFDLAHAIGKADARTFHERMGLTDPVERLSAGPVHFAHTGWALVEILPESNPSPDDNYCLIYDHPYSFEADAWLDRGARSEFPVCVMNAGYSSGWCEASFGVTLVATEILCRAKGDPCCRFIMAPPGRIRDHIARYTHVHPDLADAVNGHEIPDFFARKRLEEELRVERDLARQLVETAQTIILVLDAEGRIVSFNPYLSAICGYDLEEVKGKDWFEMFLLERDRARIRDRFRQALRGIPTRGTVNAIITRDGDERHIEWYDATLRNADGRVAGLLAVGQDITVRRRTEQALDEEREKLKRITESAQDAIIMLDAEGRISFWNRSAEQIFGYRADEALGKDLHALLAPPKFRPAYERGLEHFRRTGEGTAIGRTLELEALRRDGTTFPVEISLSRVRVDGHWHAIGIVRDITVRKDLETQLAQAHRLEAIGQLAAGIAHEINTPIQFVGDNARFLKDALGGLPQLLAVHQDLLAAARAGAVPADLIRRAETLARKADIDYLIDQIPQAIDQSLEGLEHCAKIVRAMKAFSHPGTREKGLVDINAAIHSVVTVSRSEWKYVADLVTDLDPDLPPVPAFAGDLNQVFLNMVVNAAQAIAAALGPNAPQKGTITIRTRRDGDWAEIQVADTGIGIPQHIQPRIFDLFFTTKDVGKGTGQGLAIARSVVVKRHGGTISVHSEIGRGATFTIRLPLTDHA